MPTNDADPQQIQPRLYNQLGKLLADMETGGDANLREKIESVLNDKRGTDATLRHRIEAALEGESDITTRERIAALTAIGRVLTIFAALRGNADEPDRGSAVRKYSTAFQRPAADGAGRRAPRSRSARIAAALAAADEADADSDGDSAA